jgi:ATP-dependent helicase/nuclease subunit B
MPDSFCTSTLPPPKPPIALRPRTLSATQVEMLMRDPYSVYAKHILNLKKLESIDKLPNQLEFGNLVHNIASLSSQGLDHKSLMKHIHTELRHMNMLPMVARIWMPRLERLAAWLIEFEQQRHSNNTKVYSEIKGSMQLPIDGEMFTITARADRLEVDNGSTTIIDFKTGVLPTKSDIEQGLSVQLLIEGLIARKQGFGIKTPTDIKLAYVQLGIGNKLGRIVELDLDIASALDKLEQDLIALLSKYSKEDSAYPACPDASIAPTYNEYEHLERYL